MRALWLVLVSLFLVACGGETEGPEPTAEALPDLPTSATARGGEGKADGGSALTAEERTQRRALMQSMRDRYPEQRALKALGLIGEGGLGYVTVPPEAEKELEKSEHASRVEAFLRAENADRAAYYDFEMLGYEADIRGQIAAQRPQLRDQVVDQLCDEMKALGELCESITEPAIEEALAVALDAAVEEALNAVRLEVEKLHAEFWQRRTTKAGEWIEVEGADGFMWVKKG